MPALRRDIAFGEHDEHGETDEERGEKAKGLLVTYKVNERTWEKLTEYAPMPNDLGLPIQDGVAGLETLVALDREPHYPPVTYRDGTRGGRNQRRLGRLIGKVLKPNMLRHGLRPYIRSWTWWRGDQKQLRKFQLANNITATGDPDEQTWKLILS